MRKLFVTLFLTILPLAVFAQVTTASIAGTVTDSNNTGIVGATVVAVNTSTGVTYGTSANIDGKYHLDGLKVGGEYVVTFSCVGYITSAIDKIYPALGQTVELNATLKDQPSIDSVVVVGDYKPYSNFSSQDIEAMPTVTRSIYDIARLSPFAATQQEGGVAIGALEQVQIVTAPFDVRQSGFTGGGINAVTKSGTNNFTGTAYAYYSDNNFYGRGANNTPLSKQNTFTYGVSMGGAFIENKLFYFVNAENSTNLSPSAYHIGDSNCKVAEQDAITIANHYNRYNLN